ncbi:hypothetical protein STFR1_10717 [Bacillus vallismortis]
MAAPPVSDSGESEAAAIIAQKRKAEMTVMIATLFFLDIKLLPRIEILSFLIMGYPAGEFNIQSI